MTREAAKALTEAGLMPTSEYIARFDGAYVPPSTYQYEQDEGPTVSFFVIVLCASAFSLFMFGIAALAWLTCVMVGG